MLLYRLNTETSKYEYAHIAEDLAIGSKTALGDAFNGWVADSRTGEDASYIPNQRVWNIADYNTTNGDGKGEWKEFKVHHCLVVGKDALIRTGLTGGDNARVYVKGKGSAGVLDPIDQRQSIGFKIDSVGFGSARNEAVVDYVCVPSTLNF